ncbi:N-6 DNA methylase [Glycomyces buryatensis]|uniref:DNA methylase adenine-specific domain-containing protein n=1 Tax=Glycomyces buryatensis TaxID=2570927 RepID=A0A4V4HS96_9ACTN|nr:N-6 DNA methylase [Glycomyces buryatensis]THV40786.1 hypothetical protein FAB82_14145 [Glycomyces buryatensis]
MSADHTRTGETITLTDLARLAGVGRNAVSNWRRREPDFPAPIDEASRRPRFALADIEQWAAEHGRALHVTGADRLWFSLSVDYPTAGDALGAIASALAGERTEHRHLAGLLSELSESADAAELFEFFVERAREAAGTGTAPGLHTLVDVAAACAPARSEPAVFDPACDDGDLLAATVRRVGPCSAIGGQELSAARAAIATERLRLADPEADIDIRVGDSLLGALPERRYDLVVCDPPFNVKDSGYERLPAGDDPRLAYGTPPRTEPELAWALHCLALLAPGGVAVVRMPAQVAHRRSGRRLRSELLRWGALRAVVDHPDTKAHIWVLVPRGETTQLLVSTGSDVAETWRALADDPHSPIATAHSVTVPLMSLWDEDVDISPAVYLAAATGGAGDLASGLERLAEQLDAARDSLPRFGSGPGETAPEVSLADLASGGHITVVPGAAGGSGPKAADASSAIIVDPIGSPAVRLGPASAAAESQWTITATSDQIDLPWLAAVVAARIPKATKRTATGAKRRLLSVKVPRLPLEEQRRRGAAYAKLLHLRDSLDAARGEAAALADGAAAGLVGGTVTVDGD